MNLNPGASALTTTGSPAVLATLSFNNIVRSVGGTLNFTIGTNWTLSNSQVNNYGVGALGITGGYATVAGADWASQGVTYGALAAGNYNITTNNPGAWVAASNVSNVAGSGYSGTIATSTSINSLRANTAFTQAVTIGASQTLTIASGGILLTPTVAALNTTISGGSITGSSGGDLVLNTYNNAAGTLTISSVIQDNGTATGLTKSGSTTAGTTFITGVNTFTGPISINSGTLQANGPGAFNAGFNQAVNLAGGATLNLRADGNNTGTTENVVFGDNYTITGGGTATINIDRLGTIALNKNLQLGSLTFANPSQTLQVTPQTVANGYGLEFTGTTTLNLNPTFNVTANSFVNSNVVQGLTLSGQVTGSAAVFTKAGTGTMVLSNGTNNFTGNIVLTGGVLAFNNDGATAGTNTPLGDPANTITLNGGGATTVLRAQGGSIASPILTSRTINFSSTTATANVIEVPVGNALQLNAPFGPSSNGFFKADNGTLILNADNSTWAGVATVNAGALRISNSNALGAFGATSNTVVPNVVNAALQLNGVSIFEPITINSSGINGAGAVQALAGTTNTLSGLVTLANAPYFGADAGSTVLNIAGGLSGVATAVLNAGTGANINITTTALPSSATPITKIGAGTATLQVPSAGYVAALTVNAGTFGINGTAFVGGTGAVTVQPGATFALDNSGTNVFNRLGLRPVTLAGAALNLTPSTTANVAETVGALTLNVGQTVITETANGSFQSILNMGNLTRGVGGTLLLRGSNLGSAAANGVAEIIVQTATLVGAGGIGTTNKSILPWAILDTTVGGTGTSFATRDGVGTILRPLNTTTEMVTNSYAIANANLLLTSNPGNLTGTVSNTTFNSLTLNTGAGVTINPFITLTDSSGGILATASSTISGGAFTPTAAVDTVVFTTGTSVLTISSAIAATTIGLTKAGAGTLLLSGTTSAYSGLSSNTFTGQTAINEGTLQLGANNALGAIAPSPLAVNLGGIGGAGGTLDLNGKFLIVTSLFSQGSLVGAGIGGGTITSSTNAGTLVTSGAAATVFGGSINGSSVAFAKTGSSANTLTLVGANGYGGSTLINGSNLILKDAGTLAGTSSIDINYATLTIDNTSPGLSDSTDRINNSAAVTLRGASLTYLGRAQTASSETLGAVAIGQGFSTVTVTPGGTGVNSADLTFASFAQTAGSGASVNFVATNLGLIGSNPRINISGASPASLVTAGTMINNIIPWATVGGTEFASYIPYTTTGAGTAVGGIGALSTAGYAGYDFSAGNVFTGFTPGAAINAKLTAVATTPIAVPVVSGAFIANSLNLQSTVSSGGLSFTTGTDTLNLTAGAILHSGSAFTALIGLAPVVGATSGNGRITAGGITPTAPVDLYLYNNAGAGTLTINSNIIDNTNNGGQPVRLVVTGGGTTSLTSGTTAMVVNAGLTNLSTTVTVPAGVATFNGQSVTGTGIPGGTTIVSGGGTSTIVLSNAATATSNSALTFGSVGVVTGLAATFAASANPTFTLTSGTTAGLYVGQPISGTNIPVGATISAVTGTSTFVIAGTTTGAGTAQAISPGWSGNSYGGGTVVNGGTLTLNGPAMGAVVIPASAAGLTINGGTATMTTNGGQIAASNTVTLNGSATLTLAGALNSLNGLTFNNNGGSATPPTVTVPANTLLTLTGDITASSSNVASTSIIAGTSTLDFGSSPRTITVNPITVNGQNVAPLQATLNIAGALRGTGGITITGGGVLQLGLFDAYSGTTTVNGGAGSTLQFGATNAGSPISAVNLANAASRINMNGFASAIGSLAGSGIVTNATVTPITLTTGWDNTNTTFSGTFARFNDSPLFAASLSVTKVGSGTFTFTGSGTSTGTLTVNRGAVIYGPNTTTTFLGNTLNASGSLTLDNPRCWYRPDTYPWRRHAPHQWQRHGRHHGVAGQCGHHDWRRNQQHLHHGQCGQYHRTRSRHGRQRTGHSFGHHRGLDHQRHHFRPQRGCHGVHQRSDDRRRFGRQHHAHCGRQHSDAEWDFGPEPHLQYRIILHHHGWCLHAAAW